MNNPFDISKDKFDNPIVNGLKYHIRNSEMQKERVWNYIKNGNIIPEPGDRIQDIVFFAMRQLGINESELTIADEHELIDLTYELFG